MSNVDPVHELLHGDQFGHREREFEPFEVKPEHMRAAPGVTGDPENEPLDIHIGETHTRIGKRMYPSRPTRYRPMVPEGMPDVETPSHAVIPTESGWLAHMDEFGSAVLPVYQEEGEGHTEAVGPSHEWVRGAGQPRFSQGRHVDAAYDLNEEGLHRAIEKIGQLPRPEHMGPPRRWKRE